MRKLSTTIVLMSAFCYLLPSIIFAQMDQLHGDQNYSAEGLHSGNQIKTHFWNWGQIGINRDFEATEIGGEWPINSGHFYLAKVATFFGSEVRDKEAMIKHIVSESHGTKPAWIQENFPHSSGDYDPDTGEWWTMCPLPGFYNPSPPPGESDKPWIAMSHKRWSWPSTWPDKFEDVGDPGWPDSWNGYFGKDILNADQESYYVIDDYNNKEFLFWPDSTDSLRRGLGLRVTVRGFQWSTVEVEDILFWLFDAHNIGTHLHDKMNFGMMVSPNMGGDITGEDSNDDGGRYDLLQDLGYQFDDPTNDRGAGGWSPVGFLGIAFLESPGNPVDGIDNDGDGMLGSGPVITEAMFSRTVNAGDHIVLIDYQTFERTITAMPAEGVTFTYLGRDTTIYPGEVVEISHNLKDDNLNGIIDENNGTIVGEGAEAFHRYLYEGLKYIDYFTGEGLDNPLIEEKRDDGIDNDGDWNVLFDDVGLDGKAGTNDPGEGDGRPTSGAGTLLPGEPHIDKVDIDESDMIGLTSFFIYSDLRSYGLYMDEALWEAIKPGNLNAIGQIGNTDIILGSGYFPTKPDEIRRFSFAYIMGSPEEDLFRNKEVAQKAYAANYQFSKAPLIPTLTAIPGNGEVTLYWDNLAESSFDPITGYDFEGYKIYRSTDRGWNDMEKITDGYASKVREKPLGQFDLVDDIKGFSATAYNGVQFYRGDDTGLKHSFVDTTAVNGYTYYYAVTAYDQGADSIGIYPAECSKYISVSKDGRIDKGSNVAVVRPEAPSAGFVDASIEKQWLEGSTTNGDVIINIIDKTLFQNNVYRVTFEDTLIKRGLYFFPTSKYFNVIDVTNSLAPDTLLKKSTDFSTEDDFKVVTIPTLSTFSIMLVNTEQLGPDLEKSGWNRPNIYNFNMRPVFAFIPGGKVIGIPKSNDYRIEIGETGSNTSTEFYGFAAVPVNFKLFNSITNEEIEFAFEEKDGDDGNFTGYSVTTNKKDKIIFLEKDENDSLIATWQVELNKLGADSLTTNPSTGDTLELILHKPLLSHDVFEFQTKSATVNNERAKTELDNIKVVPNPYVVSNSWEPHNPYSTGRGPRELHFIHLPNQCTIRIFNVRGQLVQTLEHDTLIWDGTEIWDMLSKDNLDISFGVYIYHVDAPGIGQYIGKFAVIK